MKSLAVKYRPNEFEDVCSQEVIIKILRKQIETNTIKNVMLFCGPSGCGKTTLARCFANKVNSGCGVPIEIDAASNNGVDNIRNLISIARERSLDSTYKVIIIDECHVLTNQAWQALLKTIEEPPTYTIFIFCTTDPQKIPATILNRCMRFNLTRISSEVISKRLMYICSCENFTNYSDSCEYISKICSGQMRDAIALLEKCADYSTDIDIANVLKILGNFDYTTMINLINSIIDGNESNVLSILNDIYNLGYDLRLFVEQFLNFCLDIQKYIITNNINITKCPKNMEQDIINCSAFNDSTKYYNYYIDNLLNLYNNLRTDTNTKTTVDIAFLKITRLL